MRKQPLELLYSDRHEQPRVSPLCPSACRQQARAGTLYAPGLTYVPTTPGVPSTPPSGNGTAAATAVAAAKLPAAAPPAEPISTLASVAAAAPIVSLVSQDDDEVGPEAAQCTQALKDGKRLLKEGSAGAAMVRFEKALMLAKVCATGAAPAVLGPGRLGPPVCGNAAIGTHAG
jgi:hypothetical protein